MSSKKKKISIPFFSPKKKVLLLEIGEEWLKIAAVDQRAGNNKVTDVEEESIKGSSEVEISQKIFRSSNAMVFDSLIYY